MSDITSMTLLGHLRTGSKGEAWQRFATIYEPLLEGWLRRRGVPTDVAEDVRQEVLTKVYQEIENFQHNGRPGAFRAWLRAVMAHRLRTIQRQRWREGEGNRPDWSDVVEQLGDEDSAMTRLWNAEHDACLI